MYLKDEIGDMLNTCNRSLKLCYTYLSKETVLLPGHGPSTTVAEEQTHNPFG
jgi:hypothetical protein